MDDNIFSALIGEPPADGSADQQAIVRQLRDQNEMGQLYSMSPTLAPQGEQMQTRALNSAKELGTRRTEGLTRARQKETDAFNKQKHADTLLGYTDIEEYIDENGNPSTRGISKSSGKMEEIQSGYTQDNSGSSYTSGVFRPMHVAGLKEAGFRMNDAGHIMAPDAKIYKTHEAFKKAFPDLAGAAMENMRQANKQEQLGTDEAKNITTRLEEHYETSSRLKNTSNALGEVLSAIEAGAVSGNVSDMFMTVDNATAQLESALSNLTLDSLTQYKLTPVSDKDLAYVRKGAAPNLTAGGLKRWATHKKEAISRMLEANQFMEDWIDANEEIPRGKKRKIVEKQIDKILHGGDFEFTFDLDAEEKRDPKYNQQNKTDMSSEVVDSTSGTPVSTARRVDNSVYMTWSPEQQKMYDDKYDLLQGATQ